MDDFYKLHWVLNDAEGPRQTVQTQTQNAASDQDLHCLLTGISIKYQIKMKKSIADPLKFKIDSSN